jgi:tetratricopeptide (TPR) repeat protein
LHQVVRKDPQFAAGFNNLGMALQNRGDWGVAALMYQDALEIDPGLAPAHCNLGEICAGSGALDDGIDHYRQALLTDPDCARGHYLLGVALLAKGRFDEVEDDYPEGPESLGQFRGPALREAMEFFVYARDCDPRWTPARNALYLPPRDEAQQKEAIEHFRQAVRLEPNFALAHGALGRALLARREFAEADAEIRRGLDLFPSGEQNLRANLEGQLLRCQHLLSMEGRLPAVVDGKVEPADADCLELAELCFFKKHYATAARLYSRALAARPRLTEDVRAGHPFNAARAAALAGTGHGDDAAGLGEPHRERLRSQARDRLRLFLLGWANKVDTGTEADRIQARKALAQWRDNPDLAVLRAAPELGKLPPDELQQCDKLWCDIDALIKELKHPR